MRERLASLSDFLIDQLIKFLILFVPLFFVFGKGEHYYFSIYDIFKEVMIQSFAVLLAGFYLLKVYAQDEDDIQVKSSPLGLPILLFLISIIVSLIQVMNIYEGMIFIKRWVLNFVILFIVYNHVSEKKQIRRYLRYLVFIGFVVSLYGILQHLKIDFKFLHQNFTGNSFFGNPNFTSEYILIIVPVAFFLIFANIHPGWCLYYIITTAVMFIFLVLNKSRAVWIGGGAAGMIVITYLAVSYLRKGFRYNMGKNEKALFE